MIGWARRAEHGYEVSSAGDKRFSALHAILPDGRSIEQWYQCDVKGYDPGGTAWRRGKGQPPIINYPDDQLYEMYLSLWRLWVIRQPSLMEQLKVAATQSGHMLTDCYASTPVNQARALAQILNEWF